MVRMFTQDYIVCFADGLHNPLLHADQQQIQYVTSKVSLVEAMHASLRETLNSLRTDVQHGKSTGSIAIAVGVVINLPVRCSGRISLQVDTYNRQQICKM